MSRTLTESVHAAVNEMTWLKPSDRAAVDLAFTYAAQIDAVLETGDAQQIVKALYLGPHLLNTLRAIGGTPGERRVLTGQHGDLATGKLAELRAAHREGRRSAHDQTATCAGSCPSSRPRTALHPTSPEPSRVGARR